MFWVTRGYRLTLVCCVQGLGCELFAKNFSFHVKVKLRVKMIKKEYWVAFDGCNENQRINVK